MSEFSEASSSTASEASDREEGLPGGAPRISSGALLGEEDEEELLLRYINNIFITAKAAFFS